MNAMTAISTRNLHKQFGETRAVQDVTFDVATGEIFSLLGPNGAGKSTTISILSCLLAPTAGDATIMGHSVTGEPMVVRGLIGVVPQDVAVYMDMSARENLLFWGKMYGLRGSLLRQRTDEILELVGLAERQREAVSRFSGGMRRRLNLGIALLHRPPVVIMDEPTVGIDPQSRRSILDGVKELNRQGMSVLYTTHYMEEAQELSDHIAIMDHGQIIASGTHEELVRLVGELDRIELHLSGLSPAMVSGGADAVDCWRRIDGIREATAGDSRVELLTEDSHRVLPRVFAAASDMGLRITSVEIREPNLEAVFLHLTGRALRDA